MLANVTIKVANFWGLERRKNVVPIRSTFKVFLLSRLDGLLESFLFSVTVSCPFPSRFFGQALSCATGEHCWTMLTSEVM